MRVKMLDKTSAISLHDQLDQIIRTDLKHNTWGANQKIPSENELAQKYAAAMNEWKKNIHISYFISCNFYHNIL